MNTRRYRITAPREYQSGGETRTTWVELGSLWLKEDGSISGVLQAIPVGNWFDGHIHAFRADDEGRGKPRGQAKREPERAADLDDDIPF